MSIRKKIFTQIAIDSENYERVIKGNIAKGILHVPLPPVLGVPKQFDSEGNEITVPTEEEIISDELAESANGIAVVFSRSKNPVPFDYVNIEASNESYLESYHKLCEEAVLNVYRIPLARLMINTEKESMNSNKTQTIWEIYTLTLKQEQKKYVQLIKELLYALYTLNINVEMGTPDFSDNRETETNLIIKAWDSGALNLKQLVTGLSKYIDVIDLNDYDFTVNPEIWEYRKIDLELMNTDDLEDIQQIEAILDDIQKE